MDVQRNENLAILMEPNIDDVAQELMERFERGISYVNFADGVVALKPQSSRITHENSPENGRRYCSKRQIPKLPAHVYSLAHDVYRDAILSKSHVEPHVILVSGVRGSGKTEISEMLVAQLLREAGVSRADDVPHTLMMGISALKRLLTCKSASGPTSSTASVIVTLYFEQGGRLRTAKIRPHLLNARHAVLHNQERGYLNIFYDLVAALMNESPGLSVKDNSERILLEMDQTLPQLNQENAADHKNHWLDFIENILALNIGQNIPLGRLGHANSFLNSLLGLLLLATTQFNTDHQTRQFHLQSMNNFSLAAELLGVPDNNLYDAVVSGTTNSGNLPPVNAVQSCDQLVFEVYSRLVAWLTDEINSKLPDVKSGDIAIHIADLPPFHDSLSESLEVLCENMTAEYIQVLQNKEIFARESDACHAEGLRVPAVKRQRCDDIVDLAFTIPDGLLHQLQTSCNNLTLSDKSLSKSMDTHFKTRKDLYIGSKKLGHGIFAIRHSHKQVEYHVDPLFRYQDLIIPNRKAQKLLANSRNMTVQNIFKPAIKEFSSPNVKSHSSYIEYVRVQLNALRDQLFGTVPHFVRCIRPSSFGSVLDEDFIKCQVKSACLPDILHRKKFGYSHWMTIPDFLKRYRFLEFSLLKNAAAPEEACKIILRKVGILEKGPAITKRCVFLIYWHKTHLDSLADTIVWKVILVQARVRGHLTRRRLRESFAAGQRFQDRIPYLRRDEKVFRNEQVHVAGITEDELFENMISRTLTRANDPSASSAWAKVIYMKQGTQVTEVYATELSLFVTGSDNPFDELELGLSYFRNQDRLDETDRIVGNIGQGIELRRDSDGSLLVKRRCQMPVHVRPHKSQPVLSADILRTRGSIPLGPFIKIFDMNEFYSLIKLEMQKLNNSKLENLQKLPNLQKSCITVITFGSSDILSLRMPCWLAVTNIKALNVLDDTKELQSLSLMTSQLMLSNGDNDNELKEEQERAKMMRERKKWSRSDQRPNLKVKEANSRKIREDLRNRGEKISDYMRYSWEEDVEHKPVIRMNQLYEEMRVQTSGVSSTSSLGHGENSPVRNWAKINVALKDALKDLQKAEVDETSHTKDHASL